MYTAAEIQMIRNIDPGAVLPGIDTKTGNPVAASSLIDVTKITQNSSAPYFYTPSRNTVTVTQAGAVLSGINFGTATVLVGANNVTIKDSTFTGTTGYYAVEQTGVHRAHGRKQHLHRHKIAYREECLDRLRSGRHDDREQQFFEFADRRDRHAFGRRHRQLFLRRRLPAGGACRCDLGDGFDRADQHHRQFHRRTPNADSPANANSDIRLTNELGNLSNVTVSRNFLLGGAYTVEAGGGGATYTVSNVSITGNYIGFETYGAFYPTTPGVSETGNTIVDFTNPAPSVPWRRRPTRPPAFQRRV